MKTEPNENAFPCEYDCSHNATTDPVQGMTKREYLIFQIQSRVIAKYVNPIDPAEDREMLRQISRNSIIAADILFTELNKS